MSLTLHTLARIPAFKPIRLALRTAIAAQGPVPLRHRLDRAEGVGVEEVDRWLRESSDPLTRSNRLRALYLVVDEWVAEHQRTVGEYEAQ